MFESFGLDPARFAAGDLLARSPIDGAVLGRLPADTPATLSAKIARAEAAQRRWRAIPAPRRGELVRLWGEELRAHKQALGALVTLEAGKIRAEGEGEVQEMIDMAEFATGQSRQLYGLTIASERPGHRMMETWHPLGVVGVITAFNFPVAVFAWNAMLALVCGDALVWKPSEKTPLTALAVLALFARACRRFGDAPEGLIEVAQGDASIGQALADDPRVPLVSATGSTRMGATLAPRVAQRFGRALLELGGNNGMIVTPSAELDLALRTILFSAIGTAGQRCTTLRRLIVHANSADALVARLKTAYATATVGDPREPGTLVGPLIDRNAFDAMQAALAEARAEGGVIHGGERLLAERFPAAAYVRPAIVELPQQSALVRRETFAPILYVLRYSEFDEALALHNDVPQGLASAIFTNDLREAERFIAASDCGIANVNIGPSGAEIGGAFGGEKATGGGREAGSEAWKAYMRRATNTINYSLALPLAQGISFGPTG
ncbi:MAG: aldehyde dehydrogenase family protein [Alphaproteobacteria bacterium]|nr:aldehyde dehydrogenase family protein [Alphaproteobacteria bacterium]